MKKKIKFSFLFHARFTQNNSLVLNNVKQLDAGIYSCQAINPFGVTTKNLSVLVVGKVHPFDL